MLRASGDNLQPVHRAVTTIRRLPSSLSVGTVTHGHDVRQRNHWNGWIRAIVIGPNWIKGRTWKAITSVPDAAPNPFVDNVLDRALQLVRVDRTGLVLLPRESMLC